MLNYLGFFRQRLKGTSTSVITALYLKKIPTNTVLKISKVVCYNGDASDRDIELSIDSHGYDHIIEHINGVTTLEWSDAKPEVFIDSNERMKVNFLSMASGKIMEAHFTGYLFRRSDIIKES